MIVFLEIVAGPDEGLKFKAEEGLMIGRVTGEIILNDPKISALHAVIELNSKGQLSLVDQGSSNGLVINGKKVKHITLLPGVVFEIGRTHVRVIQIEEDAALAYGDIITWRAILREEIPKLGGKNVSNGSHIQPLSSAIVLQFLQGVQADEVITLGYAPRSAGFHSIDICLLDDDAPEKAFEIQSKAGQAIIKNLAPTRVYLNKDLFKEAALNEGDQISFGNTIIKVGYI